jgi:hypothetical protein
MYRRVIVLVVLTITLSVNYAQVKHGNQTKLAKYFSAEAWEDLAFKCDRMILSDKYSNDPEVLLYLSYSYSKIFLICLEKQELLNKYPEYVESYTKALNYSQQAIKKDKKGKTFFPDNNDLLMDIAITGYYYIDNFVNVKKKYPKASSYLSKIMKTYSDSNFLLLKAVLADMSSDTVVAKELMTIYFNENDSIRLETAGKIPHKKTDFLAIESTDIYVQFLMEKKEPDTENAKQFVDKIQQYYPDNELIKYLSEYIDNPLTTTIKPENKLKKEVLKNLSLSVDGDIEIDD